MVRLQGDRPQVVHLGLAQGIWVPQAVVALRVELPEEEVGVGKAGVQPDRARSEYHHEYNHPTQDATSHRHTDPKTPTPRYLQTPKP